eukprot:754605-Alexandrium_andersonii.AAC.1
MSASLVGSEMCIRDSRISQRLRTSGTRQHHGDHGAQAALRAPLRGAYVPVSYTHLTLPTICSV